MQRLILNFYNFLLYAIKDIKDWINALDCVKKQTLQVNWNGGSIKILKLQICFENCTKSKWEEKMEGLRGLSK